MGWEIFHQVTLIPILIRSTKLTSKRESNYNVMITGLVDHTLHLILSRELISPGLHITYQFHPSIYIVSAMNSFSHCCIITITSSPSYQFGYQIVLALFETEVLRIVDYLQTNAFPDLVVVEQEEYPHALQKKTIKRAMSKVIREMAGRTRLGLTFVMSTSASTIHHTVQ